MSAALCQESLQSRFLTLLEKNTHKLKIRGHKATCLCPFHADHDPSFSANLEKCVWFCFSCGKCGGVRDFARLVGEEWGTMRHSPRERARFAVQARRRQAEAQARAILEQRAEVQRKALCFQNHDAIREANEAAELLALFHRRPDLAEEFPELVARTEREYADALFKQTLLVAQLQGELEVGGGWAQPHTIPTPMRLTHSHI